MRLNQWAEQRSPKQPSGPIQKKGWASDPSLLFGFLPLGMLIIKYLNDNYDFHLVSGYHVLLLGELAS